MGAVLEVLVGGVGVHGGHQSAFDTNGVVEDLRHGGKAVRRAGSVRHDVVRGVVVVRVVHSHHHRDVLATGRRRDNDLLRSGIAVCLGLVGRSPTSRSKSNYKTINDTGKKINLRKNILKII